MPKKNCNNNNNNNNPLIINPMNFIYQDPRCNPPGKCGPCNNHHNHNDITINSNHVVYVGANIPDLNIKFGDTLTSVIINLSNNSGGGDSNTDFTDDYFNI